MDISRRNRRTVEPKNRGIVECRTVECRTVEVQKYRSWNSTIYCLTSTFNIFVFQNSKYCGFHIFELQEVVTLTIKETLVPIF